VWLQEMHPEVANRDCNDCIKYVYEEDGPQNGERKTWRGQPLERPPGTVPLCRREGCKCPKGTPENPVTLTAASQKALLFYRRCKLTGQWPDDEIVMEYSIALEELMQGIKQQRMADSITCSLVPLLIAGQSNRR